MNLKIVLSGGLQSCCSAYPADFVEVVVNGWMNGICDVEVVDVKTENWQPEELASLAMGHFDERIFPLVYLDDMLMAMGSLPAKEALASMVTDPNPKCITTQDITNIVRKYEEGQEEGEL